MQKIQLKPFFKKKKYPKPVIGCYSKLLKFRFQPKSKLKNITFWNSYFFSHCKHTDPIPSALDPDMFSTHFWSQRHTPDSEHAVFVLPWKSSEMNKSEIYGSSRFCQSLDLCTGRRAGILLLQLGPGLHLTYVCFGSRSKIEASRNKRLYRLDFPEDVVWDREGHLFTWKKSNVFPA